MADRESIRHPELAKAISAFFDTDVEDGPGVLQKRDVSLVYDVGRIAAAREGYEQAPTLVQQAFPTNEFVGKWYDKTTGPSTSPAELPFTPRPIGNSGAPPIKILRARASVRATDGVGGDVGVSFVIDRDAGSGGDIIIRDPETINLGSTTQWTDIFPSYVESFVWGFTTGALRTNGKSLAVLVNPQGGVEYEARLQFQYIDIARQ